MHDVTMPKLSDSMEVGKIIEWKVKEGDTVREGDVIAEVESDKAVMELESFHSGVVSQILHGDDSEVGVGEIIAVISDSGSAPSVAEEAKPAKAEPVADPPKEEEKKPAPPSPPPPPKPLSDMPAAT